MPSSQPQPFRVIRDQLLAFFVVQLLGSCTPVPPPSAQQHRVAQVVERGIPATAASFHIVRSSADVTSRLR